MSDIVEILKFYKEIGVEFIESEPRHPVLDINEVQRQILQCTRCQLHKTKKNYVPGEGCLSPDIMFIGEGPGETEDKFGKPFIGKAGQLLEKLISRMGYSRERVFITNIVKCRPPGNREPHPQEVDACMPFLLCQLEIVKPRVVVCLGRVALNNLFGASFSIKETRGRRMNFKGTPVIPTYHPSYILHQKGREATSKAKWDTWRDMETALEVLKNQ